MRYSLRMTIPVLALLPAGASPVFQRPVQLAAFSSVEVQNGAHVIVRYGPTHRVTLVKGNTEQSRVTVNNRGVLVVNKYRANHARGYELEVEVLAPSIARVSVANGGRLEARGKFPLQRALDVDVSNGGRIDVRALVADDVIASVNQGGDIRVAPRTSLSATIAQGGMIRYWGNPRVTSSVEHGGVVLRGTDETNE